MKKTLIFFTMGLIVCSFILSGCSGSDSKDSSTTVGGGGADFDPALYYSKTDIDANFYTKSAVDSMVSTSTAHTQIFASSTPITSGTPMDVIFGTPGHDNRGMFSSASPTIVTIKENGIYMVVAQVEFGTSIHSGYRQVSVITNTGVCATAKDMASSTVSTPATGYSYVTATCVARLWLNDIIKVEVRQNSGYDLPYYGQTRMSVTKVGNN